MTQVGRKIMVSNAVDEAVANNNGRGEPTLEMCPQPTANDRVPSVLLEAIRD